MSRRREPFAGSVFTLRLRLGLTRVDLAARLGVSESTVWSWETTGPRRRSPSPLALEKLYLEVARLPGGSLE